MTSSLTDEDKIAACNICTLAMVMRDCKHCPFNIGLVYKRLEQLKQATKLTESDKAKINSLKALILA